MTDEAKRKSFTKRLLSWLPPAVIALLSAILYLTGNLYLIDNKLTDFGFQLSQRPATGDVVLVEIDAKSIQALKIWPWPRSVHAQLLDRLVELGAKRIAFDVEFSAQSRPEEDKALEAALSRAAGKVILPAIRQSSRTADGRNEVVLSVPLPEFRQHADLASVNVYTDTDGLLRTMVISDREFTSMAAALAHGEQISAGVFHIDFGIQLSTIPRFSYVDVLRGNVGAAEIAGKQVVIGGTAVELGDYVAVPIHKSIAGPFAHILGYESLKQGRALYGLATGPVVIGILIVAFFIGPLFLKWSWQRSLILLAVLLAGLIALKLGLQATAPVLADVAPMLIAVVLSFVFAVIKRVDQQALRLVFQNLDLRRKDVMMRNVVQNSFDGIITIDTSGQIESANPSAVDIFGGDVEGRTIQDFFPEMHGISDTDGLIDVLRIGMEPFELEGQRSDGQSIPIELSVSVVETDEREVFTIFFRDITERKQQRLKLEHQANHDALTELPNRKLFSDRLEQTLSASGLTDSSFAVLLLDLDRFKEVNDTLGHPTGDLLLKKISERLQAAVPDTGMIARIGGDEFALLLPSAESIGQAISASEELLQVLSEPFDLAGLTLEIGGSIGIAMYPEHGDDAASLVKCADVAMYVAKQAQSGFAIYDVEEDQNSVRYLTLTGDLRRAIQEGQLVLFYQPKINLKQNRIVAVEALIRWIHPEHGFIPPDDFIDKAEQTGVIGDMTEWVLNTAIAQAAAWQERGLEIDMAVNISARLLGDFEIVEQVKQSLRKWNVPPESLILEVTENALMDDPAKAMEVITALADLRARISIDDFGTGYSSLGYLKDLPANEMKIDKCFVQSMHESESDATIVQSTVGLAHGLGLKVVAEGIETEDHRRELAIIDCDVGQGYLFSKPLPIEEFEFWLISSPWGLGDEMSDPADTVSSVAAG